MTESKISCLACGGKLAGFNLTVDCSRSGARWQQPLHYYGCVSCGKCFASADEVGIKTAVRSGEVQIEIVRGEPYQRCHAPSLKLA